MIQTKLRYPTWFYGGPYLRVSEPDLDLPQRDPAKPVTEDERSQLEADGVFDGERLVAPFRDSNSIDEIVGVLCHARGYPELWSTDERHYFPTIQGALAEAELRLQRKTHRAGTVRRAWFQRALDKIGQARQLMASGAYVQGHERLQEAEDLVVQGNKAHRRKIRFEVGPSGEVADILFDGKDRG